MSARLTALAIEKIKAGTKRREIADAGCPGLYLIVQTSGTRSWAIRCRIDGKPTKVTLGPYPRLDLAAARDQARRALEFVDRGIDPRQQREEERREHATRRANTLRAVAEEFPRQAHEKGPATKLERQLVGARSVHTESPGRSRH